MLRLFQQFGARLSRPREFKRLLSIETLKESDDSERDKKIKIYELEIDVSKYWDVTTIRNY